MGMTSQGYTMNISGAEGEERYVLKFKGRVVGFGDLRKMLAKSNGRQRLTEFGQKNNAHALAEARLRKFQLESRLSENP